jgi:eukaryotic-like serine/threonine-protein kinase
MRALPAGCELVEALGAGSVFEVALVRREGAVCVCKRVRAGLTTDPVARAAMAREIGALERLAGAHAPALVARGEDAAGAFWLQARARGACAARVAEAGASSEALDALLARSFAALVELHARGVTHGDLNPDHLFVAAEASFIDFGLARWAGLDAALVDGAERGTLPFVAPEVLRGEAPPDAANDVFALAASVAFVAVGREPCKTSGPARLAEIAERGLDMEAIASARMASRASRKALQAALAFERSARVTTAAGVLAML